VADATRASADFERGEEAAEKNSDSTTTTTSAEEEEEHRHLFHGIHLPSLEEDSPAAEEEEAADNGEEKAVQETPAAVPQLLYGLIFSPDGLPAAEATAKKFMTEPKREGETTTASSSAAANGAAPQQGLASKVVNGLILAACFGFAVHTILNIDAGMTRGWTQSEIAMRIPLDNWLNYETSLADNPVWTKTLINVIIYLLGDWLSQTAFQGKNLLEFDVWRTLRNGFIGLCFGPLVHEYYQFSDHILPVEGGIVNRAEKILMDQTIYLTVKCSIYIAAVGLLQGDDFGQVKGNVRERLPGIVMTAWKFWPLVHVVTYGLIPARHRILWVNCVDLVWNAILATMSQKKTPEQEAAEENAASSALEASSQDEMLLREDTSDIPVLQVDQSSGSFYERHKNDVVLDGKHINSGFLLEVAHHSNATSTTGGEVGLITGGTNTTVALPS
jgi:protein Mpv17